MFYFNIFLLCFRVIDGWLLLSWGSLFLLFLLITFSLTLTDLRCISILDRIRRLYFVNVKACSAVTRDNGCRWLQVVDLNLAICHLHFWLWLFHTNSFFLLINGLGWLLGRILHLILRSLRFFLLFYLLSITIVLHVTAAEFIQRWGVVFNITRRCHSWRYSWRLGRYLHRFFYLFCRLCNNLGRRVKNHFIIVLNCWFFLFCLFWGWFDILLFFVLQIILVEFRRRIERILARGWWQGRRGRDTCRCVNWICSIWFLD